MLEVHRIDLTRKSKTGESKSDSQRLKIFNPLKIQRENGAPGEARTPDPLLRRQTLYPAELRAHSWLLVDSTKVATPIRQPIVPKSWSFWSNLEQFLGLEPKSNADILSFPRGETLQLQLHARVELGHRLGLVSHPEIVNVFLTSLSS